jgi:hypothetical protein
MRRIGVLSSLTEDDPDGQARVAAFVQTLQALGWTIGRNVQIDIRWGVADAASARKYKLFASGPCIRGTSPQSLLVSTAQTWSGARMVGRRQSRRFDSFVGGFAVCAA